MMPAEIFAHLLVEQSVLVVPNLECLMLPRPLLDLARLPLILLPRKILLEPVLATVDNHGDSSNVLRVESVGCGLPTHHSITSTYGAVCDARKIDGLGPWTRYTRVDEHPVA